MQLECRYKQLHRIPGSQSTGCRPPPPVDHRAPATALSPFTARSAPYRAAPRQRPRYRRPNMSAWSVSLEAPTWHCRSRRRTHPPGHQGDGGLDNRSYLPVSGRALRHACRGAQGAACTRARRASCETATSRRTHFSTATGSPHRTAKQLRLANRTRRGEAALRKVPWALASSP